MSNVLTSSSFKNASRQIRLNINEAAEGKDGLTAFLNESVNGKALPGHMVYLYLHQSPGTGEKFFGISAPIRNVDANGNYVMIPRQNAEGQYLSDKGEVVDDASKAGKSYEFVKNKSGEVLYGNFGTLAVVNTKQDKTPTKQTFLSLRLMSDDNVLLLERKRYQVEHANTPEQKAGYEAQLVELRKKGVFINLGINKGADFLTKLGFEVRLESKEATPQP